MVSVVFFRLRSTTHVSPEMLPSLDNFVSFGSDVFKARADYRQMALDIYTTSVTSEHLGENDAVNGCKLAESLLLNLREHFDEVISCCLVPKLILINLTGSSTDHHYGPEPYGEYPDELSPSCEPRSPD